MPDKKHRNPFEDHINSESFDVSKLGSVQERSEMELEMEAFFDSLPSELNHNIWDTELDDHQKAITAYLVTELAERILRQEHSELLEDLSDSELISILTVPVSLGLIAEERLHQPKLAKEAPMLTSNLNDYQDELVNTPRTWFHAIGEWFLKTKELIVSFFRRN